MKKYLLIPLLFPAALAFSQDCTEIFFSEYLEGSGNNKALEIYNPTNQIIDLSQYWVTRFSNGSPIYDNGGKTKLQGFILPYSTFILVNGQTEDSELEGGGTSPRCNPALQKLAIETNNGMLDHAYPAPTYMNGNDAMALFKDPVGKGNYNDFIAIDLFGAIADGTQDTDEGWAPFTEQWVYRNIYENEVLVGRDSAYIRKYIVPDGYYWIPWTSGHALFRKPDVKHGVVTLVDTFRVTLEWDTVPGGEDVWDYLGSHNCECDPAYSVSKLKDPGQLYIYPNPVENGRLNLYTTEYTVSFEIYNITGKLVHAENCKGKTGMIIVVLDNPPPGIYLLKAYGLDGEAFTRKFVIR